MDKAAPVDVAAVVEAFRAATCAALEEPTLTKREVDIISGGQLNMDVLVTKLNSGPVRHVDVLELAAALRSHRNAKQLRATPAVAAVLAIDSAYRAQSASQNAALAAALGPLFIE